VSTDVSEEHIASIFMVEKLSRERNQRESRWRRHVAPKRRLTLNGLRDVISQKMVLFITTAVRTSNPIEQLLEAVFSVGSGPRLHNEEQFLLLVSRDPVKGDSFEATVGEFNLGANS
jgi:hypothetical protein